MTKWTNESPSVEGYYWVRFKFTPEHPILRYISKREGEFFVSLSKPRSGSRSGTSLKHFKPMLTQWSDRPIPLPLDGDKEWIEPAKDISRRYAEKTGSLSFF